MGKDEAMRLFPEWFKRQDTRENWDRVMQSFAALFEGIDIDAALPRLYGEYTKQEMRRHNVLKWLFGKLSRLRKPAPLKPDGSFGRRPEPRIPRDAIRYYPSYRGTSEERLLAGVGALCGFSLPRETADATITKLFAIMPDGSTVLIQDSYGVIPSKEKFDNSRLDRRKK